MSSGGFVAVEGLGWVCLSVLREIGLSVGEIAGSMADAHRVVFQQRAAEFERQVVVRLQQLEAERKQLRAQREQHLRPLLQERAAVSRAAATSARAVDQALSAAMAQRDSLNAAKAATLRDLQRAQSLVSACSATLVEAPAPASVELESDLSICLASARASIAGIKSSVAAVRGARSVPDVRAIRTQQVAPLVTEAESAASRATGYQRAAVKAEAACSATAAGLMRARVGVAILAESAYSPAARVAAEAAVGASLATMDAKLRSAQQLLAQGHLAEVKSLAAGYERMVERGQKAALSQSLREARKAAAAGAKLKSARIEVDTSAAIVVKRLDASEQGGRQESLDSLAEELARLAPETQGLPRMSERARERLRASDREARRRKQTMR